MKKNMTAKWNCELSLQQLMSDPLVNTLMAADHVDPQELHDDLRRTARELPGTKEASHGRGFSFAECCC
jgi:hypothetical protein